MNLAFNEEPVMEEEEENIKIIMERWKRKI